ncbi:hypothetical protein GCM10028773_29220 [Spirosoma koreense]
MCTLAAFLLVFQSRAQQNSSATNIRFRIDETSRRVVIQYDLPTVQPGDSLYVEFETASGNTIRPRTVTGDVGKGLRPGTNKTVSWDVVRDGIPLNEEVRAVIRLVRPLSASAPSRTQPSVSSSPAVVSPVKKFPIIPVVGWVATGGLAIYAFTLASAINKDVDAYNEKRYAESQDELNRFNDLKASVDSKKGTFTIVAGAAAALAVANVVYMIVHKPKPGRTAFQITPGTQTASLGVTYKF